VISVGFTEAVGRTEGLILKDETFFLFLILDILFIDTLAFRF
jgi:hypothetical protein